MSINTKKNIIKNINSYCNIFIDPLINKNCKKHNTFCELNKCKNVAESHANALSQYMVMREDCKQKNKNSFTKELECITNIKKKLDIDNLNTELGHCKATKCKNLMTFNKNFIRHLNLENEKNVNKQLSKQEKHNKSTKTMRDKYGCVNKYCKNEYLKYTKSNMLNFSKIFNNMVLGKCDKKYIKYKDNEKCKTKDTKKINKQDKLISKKASNNYIKCRDNHCKQNIDNKTSVTN